MLINFIKYLRFSSKEKASAIQLKKSFENLPQIYVDEDSDIGKNQIIK